MWNTELTMMLRFIIDDVDAVKYTNDRLTKLLLVAAQFAQNENILPNTYVISLDNLTLTPDPTVVTDTFARDDPFINLTVLKAACLLASSGLLKTSKENLAVKEGSYQFDGRGKLVGHQYTVTTWCKSYKDAQWENSTNHRDPGRAVIGPYRAMAYSCLRF